MTSVSSAGGAAAKPFDGVQLYVYGHSFTQVPAFQIGNVAAGNYTTAQYAGEWPSRVARILGVLPTNQGLSASYMTDVAWGAQGNAAGPSLVRGRTFPTGSKGICVIEAGYNEILGAQYANANNIAGYKNALRTLLALMTSDSRIESSTASVSGTWATATGAQFSGGSSRQSTAVGATMTFTGVSAPAGYIWIVTVASDGTNGGAVMGVEVDGVDQGISYTGANGAKSGVGLTGLTYCPAVVKVTVPSTGTHTILVKKTDANASAAFVNVDALLIPSLTPPPVFIVKEPPNASTVLNGAGVVTVAAAYTAQWPNYAAAIDALVIEFASMPVYAVDPATGYNTTTMINPLDVASMIHPNDKGAAWIAAAVASAITANVSSTYAGVVL